MTLVITDELEVLRTILRDGFARSFPEPSTRESTRPGPARKAFNGSHELQHQIFNWVVGPERGPSSYWQRYLRMLVVDDYVALRDYIDELVQKGHLVSAMTERWQSIKV